MSPVSQVKLSEWLYGVQRSRKAAGDNDKPLDIVAIEKLSLPHK
jgi:hypothetical protein